MDPKLRSKALRTASQLPVGHPTRKAILATLERYARPALAPGDTVETDHLRIHRFMDSVRIWDLRNAGRRGKTVDVLVAYNLDYLKGNHIAGEWFERWLGRAAGGADFGVVLRESQRLLTDLDRAGVYPLPTFDMNTEKGIHVDPPQSVMKRVKFQVLDTPERTLGVEAKPSDVSIREVVFSVDPRSGNRGPYLHDTVVGNTRNRRETMTLYNWVIANEGRLKQVKNLVEVRKMLQAEGIPYDTHHLD